MKFIKLGALSLTLAVMATSLTSCGDPDPVPPSSSSSSSSSESSSTSSTSPANTTALSDDLYSFQLTLEGVTYALPAPYSEFAANGWVGEEVDTQKLDPNSATLSDVLENGDKSIYINYVNYGADVVPYSQCHVGRVDVEDDDKVSLILPKGITFGSTYDEVIAAYGEPSDLYEGELYNKLTYSTKINSSVFIYIDNATKKVTQMRVDNLEEKATSSTAAAAPASGDVPDVVKSYKAPTAVGDDWKDFNVKYGGDFYHIPAPVSAFISNGWVLASDTDTIVDAKDTVVGVDIRKDNQTLSTSVKNYSDTAQPISNCFVTTVMFYDSVTNIPIELPKGITEKSKLADITKAYGEPTETDTSTTHNSYTYGELWENIYFSFSKDTNALSQIEVVHAPKTLE